MKNILFKVLGSLPKAFHVYFWLVIFFVSFIFLVYNLKDGKKSKKDKYYTRFNLVCIAAMILSILLLIVTKRWWL